MRTTIEGIETQQSADQARAHGCHYGQGYLWAPPTPAASIDNAPITLVGSRIRNDVNDTNHPA